MSAFCIYGVSRSQCLEKAKKTTPMAFEVRPNGFRPYHHRMTERQWELSVGITAAIMFGRLKPACVSPKFDAPVFAKAWKDIAVKTGYIRDARLMVLTPTGEKHPKTKQEVLEWRPYAG